MFCVKPIKWFASSGLRWKFRWWPTARISFGISWNASIEISQKLEFAGKCGCAVNISISTLFPLFNGFELSSICIECISVCVCYIIVLLSLSGLSNRIYDFQVMQMLSIERISCMKWSRTPNPEYQRLRQIEIALESLIKTLPMVSQTIQLKPQLKMSWKWANDTIFLSILARIDEN